MRSDELPSLRHLTTFEAVARLKSVSRAAIEINRSQPAVTQALAKLEAGLGVDVVERQPSGSYPTELGGILLQRTHRLLEQIGTALTQPRVGAPLVEPSRLRSVMGKVTSHQVRCLVALADSGSLDSAAREVDVSSRSVVRYLRELEQILGRSLTRNTAQGIGLTQGGSELGRSFRVALKEMQYAIEEIGAARRAAQSRIAIGAVPQCATLVLASAIDEFLRQEPAAHIAVVNGPYLALLTDLRMGRIDLLFGVMRKPEWASDVHEEPLFAAPYAIIVRKDHPLSSKGNLQLDDLADYEWILPQHGTPRRKAFERMFDGARRKPASCIETSTQDLQVALIGMSDRITMMSAQEARRIADSEAVVTLDFKLEDWGRRDGVATRAGWLPTASSQLFLDLLRQRARLAGARSGPDAIVHAQPAFARSDASARVDLSAGRARPRFSRSVPP